MNILTGVGNRDGLPPLTQSAMLNHYDFKLRRWKEKWTELRAGTLYMFASRRSSEVLESHDIHGHAIHPVSGSGHLAGKRFAVSVARADDPEEDGILFAARTEKAKMSWIRDISLASIDYETTQEEKKQRRQFEAQKEALAARVEARARVESAPGASSPPNRMMISPARRSSSLKGGTLLPSADARMLSEEFGSHDQELAGPRAAETLSEMFGLKLKSEAVSSESLRLRTSKQQSFGSGDLRERAAAEGSGSAGNDDEENDDSDSDDKYAEPQSDYSDETDLESDEESSYSSSTDDGAELNASIVSKQSSGSLGAATGSPRGLLASPRAAASATLTKTNSSDSVGLAVRKNASTMRATLEAQVARRAKKAEAEKRERKRRLFDYFTIVTKNNPGGRGASGTGGMPKLTYRYPPQDFDDFPFDFKMAIFACAPPEVATSFGQSRPCIHASVMNRQADVCNIFIVSLTYRLEAPTTPGSRSACDDVAELDREGETKGVARTEPAIKPLHSPTQAICILSQWPMFKFHEALLRRIYRILVNPDDNTCIESLLEQLQTRPILPDPPKPLGGLDTRSKVQLILQQAPKGSLEGDAATEIVTLPDVELRQLNESPALPYVDRLCFEYLFSCLCVDNVITLMGHMLCNRSIIFVAEHLSLLAPVCEALCALLHPYDCTSIYIPYLPKSLFGLLSSPVNFMVGVLKEDFVDKSMKQQRANLSCYVVWLGKDKVQYWHEGHPPTEDAVEGHPTLPINLHEGLEKEMAQWVALSPKGSYRALSRHLATSATLERKQRKSAAAVAETTAATNESGRVTHEAAVSPPPLGLTRALLDSTPTTPMMSPSTSELSFFQVPEMSVELSDIETLNCGRVRTAAVAAMKGLMYGITDPELEQITNITLQGSPSRKHRSIREILSAAFTGEHLDFLCTFFEGQVWATFADTFLGPDGPLSSSDVRTAKHFLRQLSFGFRNPYANHAEIQHDTREVVEVAVQLVPRGAPRPPIPSLNVGSKKEVHFNFSHNQFPALLPAFPRNPMDPAIRAGDTEAVAAFLRGEGGENGMLRADPNVCDINSVAPLHLAAAFGHAAIAKLLLDARANPRQALELHCEDPFRLPARANALHFLAHCVVGEGDHAALIIERDVEKRKLRKPPALPSPVAAKADLGHWLEGAELADQPRDRRRRRKAVNGNTEVSIPPLPPKREDAEPTSGESVSGESESETFDDDDDDSGSYTESESASTVSESAEPPRGPDAEDSTPVEGDQESGSSSPGDSDTAAVVLRRPRAPSTADAVAAAVQQLDVSNVDTVEAQQDPAAEVEGTNEDDDDNQALLVRLLVTAKCSPVQRAANGYTAMHIAAETGNSQVMRALLKYAPEGVNLQNKLGWSPLHVAASRKQVAVTLVLVDAPKVNLRLKLGNGMLPVHVAARSGCMEVVRAMIERDLTLVNVANTKDQRSPLHYAVEDDDDSTATVGLLLDHHADVNATTNIGDTPLGTATRRGSMGIARLLLAAKAHVNPPEEDMKDSPLFAVIKTCDLQMLELLLRAKCNPMALDEYGKSALHVAARPCDSDIRPIIERLVLAKCDPNQKCHMGWTPLFEATQFDTIAAVSGLAACKANIDAFGPTLTTALQSAVAKEDHTMITTLLEAGASTVVRTDTGLTALHIACATGNPESVRRILSKAKEHRQTRLVLDNSTNDHEETPLFVAAQYDHPEICELLLNAKADPMLKTRTGETPLWVAARHGYIRTAHILTRAEPKCCVIKDEGLFLTPFEVAHRFHYRSLSEWLLLAQDFSPLHFAADLRDAEAITAMLAAKADPDAKTPGSQLSALDVAFEVDEDKGWLAGDTQVQELLNGASQHPRGPDEPSSRSGRLPVGDDDGDSDDDATEDFEDGGEVADTNQPQSDDDEVTEDFEGTGVEVDADGSDDDESTEDMQ